MDRFSLQQMALAAVIILGVIAILYIAATAMGVPIPTWVVQMLWVIAIVVAAAVAIRFIAGQGPKS